MRDHVAIVLALSILSAGYATACSMPAGPNIEHMQVQPSVGQSSALPQGAFAKKKLLVGEVEGEEQGSSQQNLREALWFAMDPSLERSHIFGAVVTNGAADYRLDATIVSHKELTGAITATSAVLMVRYKLTDTATNAVIWRETITSHYDAELESSAMTMSLLFGPGAVVPKISAANEGAVRDNLTRLVDKLAALSVARGKG
jgi:hypothetical protein